MPGLGALTPYSPSRLSLRVESLKEPFLFFLIGVPLLRTRPHGIIIYLFWFPGLTRVVMQRPPQALPLPPVSDYETCFRGYRQPCCPQRPAYDMHWFGKRTQ